MKTTALTVCAALLAAVSLAGGAGPAVAQAPAQPAAAAPTAPRKAGPVIQPFGSIFEVPASSLMPPDAEYKVKFDAAASPQDPKAINPAIDSVARFLNMQVGAGVPKGKMKLALVLHGSAAKDTIGNAGYRARHGVDNPNLPLLEALANAGVQIYLCGQSAAGRGIKWDEVAPVAKVALSAMTVHAMLAREGYSTNPF